MVEKFADVAASFIGVFNAGGEYFMSIVTGIIPTLLVLLTFINLIIRLIGEERVMNFMKKCTKYAITRYTILPVLAMIFLTDPMCHTMGKFLDEKYKAAFYDCEMTFVHPVTGLFPHANPAELFIYMGIANGIAELGFNKNILAIWYFAIGIIMCLIRGIVTEKVYMMLEKRKHSKALAGGGTLNE